MTQILVVDDAATVRLYHRTILQEAGYLVDEAVNGIEALEKALRQDFALYLVDVNMPKLDGYEFLKALRREAINQAPVIMVSTESTDRDKRLAYQAGANFFLIKPIKPGEMLLYVGLLVGRGCP